MEVDRYKKRLEELAPQRAEVNPSIVPIEQVTALSLSAIEQTNRVESEGTDEPTLRDSPILPGPGVGEYANLYAPPSSENRVPVGESEKIVAVLKSSTGTSQFTPLAVMILAYLSIPV